MSAGVESSHPVGWPPMGTNGRRMRMSFNLVDEPWIPIVGRDRVSLLQIFSEPNLIALGGNAVEKIALMKLLIAIGQAAATPQDDREWREAGADGVASKCVDYLNAHRAQFDLYGELPFLQMPAISACQIKSYGTVLPEIATGNSTVLTRGQVEQTLSEAEKAVLLVRLMGFALGGKKTDNSVVLTPGYMGKQNAAGRPSTGKPGPSMAYMGLLHTLLQGHDVRQSVWLNLLSHERVQRDARFPGGIGTAPWECMPHGEDDATARALKDSLMGRLVPMCRFCLLVDSGLHYSEGIVHDDYGRGRCDPSVAVAWGAKPKTKALWANPEKRPWRELTALLGFWAQNQRDRYECLTLSAGIDRAVQSVDSFGIWSGGLRVSSNAGEQYASGTNDFVESLFFVQSAVLGNIWFSQLQAEMLALEEISKQLYGHVCGYHKAQMADGTDLASKATLMFWQSCERDFQTLIDHCDSSTNSGAQRKQLRRRFSGYAQRAYDLQCPNNTARQMDAWARYRPNYSKYLK